MANCLQVKCLNKDSAKAAIARWEATFPTGHFSLLPGGSVEEIASARAQNMADHWALVSTFLLRTPSLAGKRLLPHKGVLYSDIWRRTCMYPT